MHLEWDPSSPSLIEQNGWRGPSTGRLVAGALATVVSGVCAGSSPCVAQPMASDGIAIDVQLPETLIVPELVSFFGTFLTLGSAPPRRAPDVEND